MRSSPPFLACLEKNGNPDPPRERRGFRHSQRQSAGAPAALSRRRDDLPGLQLTFDAGVELRAGSPAAPVGSSAFHSSGDPGRRTGRSRTADCNEHNIEVEAPPGDRVGESLDPNGSTTVPTSAKIGNEAQAPPAGWPRSTGAAHLNSKPSRAVSILSGIPSLIRKLGLGYPAPRSPRFLASFGTAASSLRYCSRQ